MEEGELFSFNPETKQMKISADLSSARFFDICDPSGRIIHKLNSTEELEFDLSFLGKGKYVLWTFCEGATRQFHFTI